MKEILLTLRKLIARSNVLSFRFCIFFSVVDLLVVYVLDFVCQVLSVVCIVFLMIIMSFIVFFFVHIFFFSLQIFLMQIS
jgi:hypothetical protein